MSAIGRAPGPRAADPTVNTQIQRVQVPPNGCWLETVSSASVLLTFEASIFFFLIYRLNKWIRDRSTDTPACPAEHQDYF